MAGWRGWCVMRCNWCAWILNIYMDTLRETPKHINMYCLPLRRARVVYLCVYAHDALYHCTRAQALSSDVGQSTHKHGRKFPKIGIYFEYKKKTTITHSKQFVTDLRLHIRCTSHEYPEYRIHKQHVSWEFWSRALDGKNAIRICWWNVSQRSTKTNLTYRCIQYNY